MHVFGPLLVAQGAGHVVCTASAAGVSDTPTMGAYGVTEHAVVGLAAALVYRAVLDDQFFVFPTSDLDALIEARMQDVRQGLEWRDGARKRGA